MFYYGTDYWLCNSLLFHKKSDGTRRRYSDIYERQIKDDLGWRDIKSIDFATVQQWVNVIGLEPATVRLCHGVLSGIYKLAIKTGRCEKDPTVGVSLPSKPRRKDITLCADQVSVILYSADECISAGVFLAMALGLRLGEVCGLKWIDFDKKAKTLTIRRQALQKRKKGVSYELCDLKTKSSRRTLYLTDGIVKEIVKRGTHDSEFICGRNGGIYLPETLSEHWRNFARDNGINLTFHDLRHVFTNNMVASGAPLFVTMDALGHSDVKTTRGYYTTSNEEMRKALENVGKNIGISTPRKRKSAV